MKKSTILIMALALAGFGTLHAQLNVPSDGSDGVLNITSNTVIDLSLASTGVWNQNNSTNAGHGVYDSAKWAIVFKYSSVNIAGGATVTFANHPTHAPVVWLVQSNATNNGTIDLAGKQSSFTSPDYLTPVEPGPGGYRGGANGPTGAGGGYGLGGVHANRYQGVAGYVGIYGNPQISPLVGGSGGAGSAIGRSGPGGGGAILIAASGIVSIGGQITANATGYHFADSDSSYSSAGAIKVIANQVLGAGTISAARTRIEANSVSPQLIITPNTSAVPPGATPVIWPAASSPTVNVVSVNAQPAPENPLAAVITSSDVTIQTNNPVDIILVSQNFPPSGLVSVRVNPKYGDFFLVNASYVSGTFTQATWKATTALPPGFCVLQAHAHLAIAGQQEQALALGDQRLKSVLL